MVEPLILLLKYSKGQLLSLHVFDHLNFCPNPMNINGDKKTSRSNIFPLVFFTFCSSLPSYTDITKCQWSTVPHKNVALIHQTIFQDQALSLKVGMQMRHHCCPWGVWYAALRKWLSVLITQIFGLTLVLQSVYSVARLQIFGSWEQFLYLTWEGFLFRICARSKW